MFCAKCGGAIPDGGGFCVKCGAAARPALTPDGRFKRPGLVTLIAILDWIGGGFWLLVCGVGLIGVSVAPAERDPFTLSIFVMLLLIGVTQVLSGIGLWRLKPFGWWLQVILACFGLLGIPLGTLISIVILIYFNRPGIKLLFSDRSVDSLTAEEQALVAAAATSSGATTVIVAVLALLVLVFVVGIVAALAVPGLLRARMSGNEASAISRLRAFSTAETSYALGNRMLYDRPDCLLRPSGCVAAYSGPASLQEHPEQRNGYRFAFYPGAPPEPLPDGASRSSMTTYVMTAVPVSNSTGQRQFCVDQTGEVKQATLTAESITSGPACPSLWPAVR